MAYRYEIDENNAVRVFEDDKDYPLLYQPDYPSGEAWTREQAEQWAIIFVEAQQNPNSEYVPGSTSETPAILRSSLVFFDKEELRQKLLSGETLTAQEINFLTSN